MANTKRQALDKNKLKQQENRIEALQKLLAYYKEITETVREPFIILDKDLHVVTANMAFYKKFKVRKKDTEGKRIYELGNNQWDALRLRQLLEHILPKHRVFTNYEVTYDFPVLGKKTMLLNARQVDSKQLILLAIEDVTVQRQLKRDADELTAYLVEQRDRLEAINNTKDEFISLASHQLRTPATAVKQYIGMITEGFVGKVTKEQMQLLKVAYASNERQLEIIDELLRVAKVDDGKVYLEKSSCDVGKQLKAVIKSQESLFKTRDQTVVLQLPSKKVVAWIDEKLMRMVLENILDNAGKYSPMGEQVAIDVAQNNKVTTVAIKDRGVGINKEQRHKLFRKFSRIDNSLSVSVGGTGLGLYWAKKILDLHQGDIEVTARRGGGTIFKIEFPVLAKL